VVGFSKVKTASVAKFKSNSKGFAYRPKRANVKKIQETVAKIPSGAGVECAGGQIPVGRGIGLWKGSVKALPRKKSVREEIQGKGR